MTSTQPIRSAPAGVASPATAVPGPITCVEGNQLTPQNTLSTMRLAVKEKFFPVVFGCMSPEVQEKIKSSANVFDPAVQDAIMAQAASYVPRITDVVRSESPTEVTFKMAPEGSGEFAKFILNDGKWYMA